jgi:hypothetical protein
MQVFDDRFQAVRMDLLCSSILTVIKKNCMKLTSAEYTVENS